MLIDGRTLTKEDVLTTDVCIIGAGAAGLTLAQAFEGASFSVMLLESGGFQCESSIQALAEGTSEQEPYPFSESRARCFGGSTTRWSGACVPLDPGDFQFQAWLPHSGWPFERSVLQPYYQQARRVFGLPETTPPLAKTSAFHQPPLETKQILFSQPLDLGRKYRRQIVRSPNITLVTYANVSQLISDSQQQQVLSLKISGPSEQKFTVQPQTVILATGGMENARLLLASNQHCPKGLGNSYDVVGRFFMEHYLKTVGILPLNQQQQAARFFTDLSSIERTHQQGTFGLTDELRQQQQLLNLHIRCYRYSLLEDTAAVIAAKQLPTAIVHQRDFTPAALQWQSIRPNGWKVLPQYLGWHLWNKINKQARFTHMRLQAWIEQAPDPNNRITLSSEKDPLGQPKTHLTFSFSQQVWDSVVRSRQTIEKALFNQGLGSLQYSAERLQHLTHYDKIGLHHMGTTRMHNSPMHGVVDANCKVHGLANLYIAGSSVFPTGGAANPTLTIAALALRLAEHIRKLKDFKL